jgi:hypothetical protein
MFYDLSLFLFFVSKCQHLVFENKQENKLVNKYNVLQAKHEFVNFWKKSDLKGNGAGVNHPKNGLFLGRMKIRKWNLCQWKKFYDLFIYLSFTAKCQHLVFEKKQENKLANNDE